MPEATMVKLFRNSFHVIDKCINISCLIVFYAIVSCCLRIINYVATSQLIRGELQVWWTTRCTWRDKMTEPGCSNYALYLQSKCKIVVFQYFFHWCRMTTLTKKYTFNYTKLKWFCKCITNMKIAIHLFITLNVREWYFLKNITVNFVWYLILRLEKST